MDSLQLNYECSLYMYILEISRVTIHTLVYICEMKVNDLVTLTFILNITILDFDVPRGIRVSQTHLVICSSQGVTIL